MSKATHTPGPWAIRERKGDGCVFVGPADNDFFESAIVRTKGFNGPEARANARLVAAAPDLLAALEDVATMCEGRVVVSVAELLPAVLAALAKANGES